MKKRLLKIIISKLNEMKKSEKRCEKRKHAKSKFKTKTIWTNFLQAIACKYNSSPFFDDIFIVNVPTKAYKFALYIQAFRKAFKWL